jgi:diguanylate cyclase (GGDEF)-like protein
MSSLFLRRLISVLGLFVAVAIALATPLGYGLISHSNEAGALSFQARLNAGHLAKYIEQNGPLWPSHKARVAEIVKLNGNASNAHSRIYAADGAVVYKDEGQLPGPTITRSEPLVVGGTVVGRVEAVSSLLPMLVDGGLIAIMSFCTAALVYFQFRVLPIKLLDRVAHMAHHDDLTGLPNRVMFRKEMQAAANRARRGERHAVLCLDLDQFKAVNDTLGHPAGDALLRMVAQRLRDCVHEHDTVARLGGDEFAIVQVAADQPAQSAILARRIVESLSKPYDLDGQQAVIGASLGIAIAPDDSQDPDQLLACADMALYRAKADGGGTHCYFEPEMDAKMQFRRALERDLRQALARGEFEIYYQALVNIEVNQVSGFEALLRWKHPERGIVSPTDFIPLAEEIGLIGEIGRWVLKEACAEAAKWPRDVKLAVNLSSAQFKSRTLVLDILAALGSSGLSPSRLELEITETVMLQDTEATLATLQQLRKLGVRISMDDFGTGYSSLSYLRKFPFDKIKVDRSFINDMSDEDSSVAIVRAVAGLGVSLGMSTIAEGVETEEQLEKLRSEGYTEVQGFLFAAARPAGEVPGIIARVAGRGRAAA